MDRVLITEADPRGPDAQEALTAYVLEVREAAGLDALDVEPALRDVDGFVQAPGFFLIATREARVVGCVGLRPWRGTTAEIKRMWVAPDLRGTGLAVTLLDEVEQRAFARGFARLLLDTNGALTRRCASTPAADTNRSRGTTTTPTPPTSSRRTSGARGTERGGQDHTVVCPARSL
jgi:GNAT superfamily N-acetyltransferase